MTQHARERLADRFPEVTDADAAIDRIAAEVARPDARQVAIDVCGRRIYEVWITPRIVAFPMVTEEGAIQTILEAGMEVRTPTGIVTLERWSLGEGVHHEIDASLYHADPAPQPSLSSSLARKLLEQSPHHAWWDCPRLNPDWTPSEKLEFDVGRAAHREVLGRGGDFVSIPPEILASNGAASTKAAKNYIANAREQGLTPVKPEVAEAVRRMSAATEDALAAMGIAFDHAASEQVAIARIDGTWCRAMIDNAPPDGREPLYDFKTTTDASPRAIERSVSAYGYDVQAQHYLDVWRAATGEDRRFRFVFVEKAPPHGVAVVEIAPATMEIAARKTRRARQVWQTCLRQDAWPGYPAEVIRLDLPEWHASRWLERESVEADYRRRTGVDVYERATAWQAPENDA